jgi:hypothetical protein
MGSGDLVIARDRVIGKEQIAVIAEIARNRSEISSGANRGIGTSVRPKTQHP